MLDAGYEAWMGRSETESDVASASRIAGLAALLDEAAPAWRERLLPPLGHWLHFRPTVPQSQIDADGHPKRGGLSLLPPIPLPRRMWAGSRIWFNADIELSAAMERRTTIGSITPKRGRSGDMVLVTLVHEIESGGRMAIREEQDIVYREPGERIAAAPPGDANCALVEGARRVTIGPVELFRYSALTFNAHRIHYDREYAQEVEGYPGLVVQGPLTATLLLTHFLKTHPGSQVQGFSFRAQAPLFAGEAFDLIADGNTLRAVRADGTTAVIAEVRIA